MKITFQNYFRKNSAKSLKMDLENLQKVWKNFKQHMSKNRRIWNRKTLELRQEKTFHDKSFTSSDKNGSFWVPK